MRHLLRIKIVVIVISLSLLVLVPLLESKFNSPVIIKKWDSKLTWNDFQGFPKILSNYSAAIHSKVYLDYDSINKKFYSYAGQNNIRSWAKDVSDYGLCHEQYHFNITEVHARYLNQYIHGHPDKEKSFYESKLESLQSEMNKMQDQYDEESNHSLRIDQQRRWEYKVDSLMNSESGWVTDYFSGAHIFFPKKPELKRAVHLNGSKDRIFYLEEYEMIFGLSSVQLNFVDLDLFRRNLMVGNESFKIISIDTSGYPLKAQTIKKEDSGFIAYSALVCDSSYMLIATSKYKAGTKDSLGFMQMAKSFIGSLSIVNTDEFWIEKVNKSTQTINKSLPSSKTNIGFCLNINRSADLFFYRGPFYNTNGAMMIAYDNFYHPDSLIYKNVLQVGGNIFSNSSDSLGRFFIVPRDQIPTRDFKFNFGYLLKEDSIRPCYNFYYQTLEGSITKH